ncbi:MAG: DNA primase [Parcubacteria group bacterium Gr01-1014_44]|nr:MAG: DNA primase [Parcubacteria group bacterium Gr01-1014_44]
MTDTQAIKDRLDIVQIIGEYIPLKKAGANWKANCPFHHEKSPSFMVHPEKQFWHCFGCGKGGDVFSFLQEMEGLDFPEALKILADRAGVKLDTFASEVNKSQKNRILEINAKAAYFFHQFLLEMPASRGARDYLQRRELKSETIEEWQVGFIPDQWDLLTQYLLKKGNSVDDLIASGLTIKKDNGGFYDRFRGRIMFPLWDTHGNIVGFTGRVLVETEKFGGKYVNTPQTLVYDKSRILYGLNKAKTEIKNKDFTVLVEGQMDVIACHQAGMKNVVASSGTALTFEQIKLLKRYSNNISIAFDADAAGQNAAKRGIDLALEQGMNIKIIQIPAGCGKDADECLKKDAAVWFKAVENAKEVMEWYFASVLVGADKRDPKQKQKIADTLLSEIIRLPYAVERDHWLKKLADELSVDHTTLTAEMRRLASARPKHYEGKQENIAEQNPKEENWGEKSKSVLLTENIFALFIKFPKLLAEYDVGLKGEFFPPASMASLYESLKKQYNGSIDAKVMPSDLEEEHQNSIDILVLKADKDYGDFNSEEAKKELSILLASIKSEWQKNKRVELFSALKEAEKDKNTDLVQQILKQIMEID